MITATLRKPNTPAPVIDAEVVSTENKAPAPAEPGIEHKSTVGGQDLTDIIPVETAVAEAENPESSGGSSPEPGEAATALVPRTGTAALSRPSVEADNDGFDESDDKYPVLRIVAGSGKLASMFQVGCVILGNTIDEADVLLNPPDLRSGKVESLRFIPLALSKAWRENLTDEETKEDMTPRYFKTKAEVEEAGGCTVWIGNTPPSFKPTATCLMLVEQPEGSESSLFTLPLDGKMYCPAVFYSSNSSYAAFAQVLYNSGKHLLQVPVLNEDGSPAKDRAGFALKKRYYPKFPWTFTVKKSLKKRDDREFTVYTPEIKAVVKEPTGPEVEHYFTQLASASVDAE